MYRERAGRVRWGGGAMRTIHDAKQESTRALLGATALSPLFLSLGVSVVFAEETETVVIHITRSLVSPPPYASVTLLQWLVHVWAGAGGRRLTAQAHVSAHTRREVIYSKLAYHMYARAPFLGAARGIFFLYLV